MTFFSKQSTEWAVEEWKTFAELLQRDHLEQYEYWQDLSMRESFENGERELTPEMIDIVKKADEIVRQKLVLVLKKYNRFDEYRDIAQHIPKKYWWWHLEEEV